MDPPIMEIRIEEFLPFVPESPRDGAADWFFAWCAHHSLDPAAIAFMTMRDGSPEWIRESVHRTIYNMDPGDADEFLQRTTLRFDPGMRVFYVGVNQH